MGWVGIEHFRFPGPQIKERQIGGRQRDWGNWSVGWVGIEHFRLPEPHMRVGERGAKVKLVGKGKFGLGGN